MGDVEKRDVDPNVGGGVDRDKLSDSDFVFSDSRTFPIVTPADVSDAVHSWGRYRGPHSFEEFQRRLIALCRRKGAAFVAALPDEWKQNKSVKAIDEGEDWELDILGVPFGGPEDKDSDGEYFAADTQTHEDKFPLPPLVYYHGLDDSGKPTGDPEYIGKTTGRRVDEHGIWFRGVLDKTSALAKRVWDAARMGLARASSGTAAHLRRVDSDGHIRQWPVVELSVFEALNGKQPANPYAVALPVSKAIYKAAGINWPAGMEVLEATPGAEQSAAGAMDAITTVQTKTTTQGVTEMEANELKTALAEAVRPLVEKITKLQGDLDAIKAEPAVENKAAGVSVTHDEADNPFTTLAEQCIAVKSYEVSRGRHMDPRLGRLEHVSADDMQATKQTGANEGTPSMGGFLLEPTLGGEFLRPLHEAGPFSRMVRPLPVSSNSNYGWVNGVDETSRATGSRWGGIQGYRMSEGGAKTPSRPKFRRINWELKKYAVLVYGTDELLQDAAMFSTIVTEGASEEINFMANDDIFEGIGLGGPLGILTSGCLVTVNGEAGQLADTVVNENINNMWQRLLPECKPRAAWFVNSEVWPQLDDLAIAVGAGALEPRNVTYGPDGVLRLKGRPVYETEFNTALGEVGDILLADMSQYLFWEKGGVQSAQSVHVAFLTDETVFRFVYRCDGQPALAAPITPFHATAGATQSPFVTLAAR